MLQLLDEDLPPFGLGEACDDGGPHRWTCWLDSRSVATLLRCPCGAVWFRTPRG